MSAVSPISTLQYKVTRRVPLCIALLSLSALPVGCGSSGSQPESSQPTSSQPNSFQPASDPSPQTPSPPPTPTPPPTSSPPTQSIKTVFLILMENHNWSLIKGSAQAPYINNTLLPMGAHAEQYFNPPGNHPSLPNYLWLEAGTNFGVQNDDPPSINHQSSTMHLVTLLKSANISWKSYDEDISGTSCPLNDVNQYAAKHDPFVYFDDVTNSQDPNSAYCSAHIRPFTELIGDLQANTVARYNFITPNLCDDMHSCDISSGDAWLAQNLPTILDSAAYKQNGVVFITWDEGSSGDGPIGMIVLSPLAKAGYGNSIHYDHGSTLRTIEEILQVTPLLGDAAKQTDLSDLFSSFP